MVGVTEKKYGKIKINVKALIEMKMVRLLRQ